MKTFLARAVPALLLLLGANTWARADASMLPTVFLRIAGEDAGAAPAKLHEELDARFLKPLAGRGRALLSSYTVQTSGGGVFYLNLVLQARESADALTGYEAESGEAPFHGVAVRFRPVVKIFERATLEAGRYRDGQEDPFDQGWSTERAFAFSSLRDWIDFTNGYGFALLAKDNRDFIAYLQGFVGPATFAPIRDQIIAESDMVAIFPLTYLVLDGNEVTGPEADSSPFLPYRFFRNCYESRFEGGNCYKASVR